jgi:hypothetical protein
VEAGASRLGEGQQIVDEPARRQGRVDDVVQEALGLGVQLLGAVLQQLGIADDMAERRAQVVRHGIGEGLQLLIGAGQFIRELSALLGAFEHEVEHGAAEVGGAFHLGFGPGQ